jgi:hypothetical protein
MIMRLAEFVAVGFSLLCTGCAVNLSSQPRPTWETGFWYWHDYGERVESAGEPIDVVFIHVGRIQGPEDRGRQEWGAYSNIPLNLPKSRRYWLVFRYEHQRVPDMQAVRSLGDQFAELAAGARRRGLPIAGVQLDIDSPTNSLPQYAKFLHAVRKELPTGWKLSITGLLDWFRNSTAIDEVIREADEFVPQFYDVSAQQFGLGQATASPIDAARWGPVFNRFRKPFRVGISTFGRASSGTRPFVLSGIFGDLKITDVAMNAAFQMSTAHNAAKELILTYRAGRRAKIGYIDFAPGDSVQFIVATPELVRDAVAAARQMGGSVAGVVFFRWPGLRETSTMEPDEVLAAAGVLAPKGARYEVGVVDGHCAAVSCVDLYLKGARAFSPEPTHHRIKSSVPLEYFLPEKGLSVNMIGASNLELALPPYCERGHLYLGRAITSVPSQYSVEEP